MTGGGGRALLVYDSGLGGLSVVSGLRRQGVRGPILYLADHAAFPYGDKSPEALVERIRLVLGQAIDRLSPAGIVVACNTASTLALADLRHSFPDSAFIGVVPAVKPVAERSTSRLGTVLATPMTAARDYTARLIANHAGDCAITVVGAPNLARLAEDVVQGHAPDHAAIRAEITGCFREVDGRRTDAIALACTHFPLIQSTLMALAPWPVSWIDPSDAVARQVLRVLPGLAAETPARGIVLSTRPPSDPGPGLANQLLARGLSAEVELFPLPAI